MKKIKFRYVFRRKDDGHIYMFIVSIVALEEALEPWPREIKTMLDNELWKLINRDQFTGLKDKNGVEIYEGDIVRSAWDSAIAEIKFGSYAYNDANDYGDTTNFIGFCWAYPGQYETFGLDINDKTDHYEVIGNIYETPELLP